MRRAHQRKSSSLYLYISGMSFLTPIISTLLSLVLNWMTPNWKNCWMCLESTGVQLVMASMILRDSGPPYACITSFLMKIIDPPNNLNTI